MEEQCTREQRMEALIREVLDDEPRSDCAENGTSCPFCYQDWHNAYPNKPSGIDHTPDCWLVRARKVLEDQ